MILIKYLKLDWLFNIQRRRPGKNKNGQQTSLTLGKTLQRVVSWPSPRTRGSVSGSGSTTATAVGGIGSPEYGLNIRKWNIFGLCVNRLVQRQCFALGTAKNEQRLLEAVLRHCWVNHLAQVCSSFRVPAPSYLFPSSTFIQELDWAFSGTILTK